MKINLDIIAEELSAFSPRRAGRKNQILQRQTCRVSACTIPNPPCRRKSVMPWMQTVFRILLAALLASHWLLWEIQPGFFRILRTRIF